MLGSKNWWCGSVCVVLSGCGVPQLYAPPPPGNPAELAPKVSHIVDEISCELWSAQDKKVGLKEPYIITILLTLQVEDNLDLTPSLSFIHPFMITGHSRTTSISGDLGGDRKRVFTTTYYLDSTKLTNTACTPEREHKKLFKLAGDLGLADVVRDGDATILHEAGESHTPKSSDDKSIPTYGSTIQFIVMKSVTGLGPVWTIQRFKGPGGTNGLLNGKRVNTDIVTITFAKQVVAPTGEQIAAKQNLNEKTRRKGQTQLGVEAAARRKREVEGETSSERPRLEMALRARNAPRVQSDLRAKLQALEAQRADAQGALSAAQSRDLDAERALDQANDRVASARQSDELLAPAAATAAGQNLLTTMVLQNLNIQPR